MAKVKLEELIEMFQTLLAGGEVEAVTPEQVEAKADVLRDIAYAKKMGYQIELPSGE